MSDTVKAEMNRDTVIAYAWKPITEPPEGDFVSGCRYLGYHSQGGRINVFTYIDPDRWLVAGLWFAPPDYWQDEPPPPAVALAFQPLEPPRILPLSDLPLLVTAAPARNLRTLAAFAMAGKHYLTMNEATAMFDILTHDSKYITYVTPQGPWVPQLDAETYNCLGYRFQHL